MKIELDMYQTMAAAVLVLMLGEVPETQDQYAGKDFVYRHQ